MKMSDDLISSTIDELGNLKAQIADLKKREDELKDILESAGVTKAEGDLFRVTITESVRETLDMEAVREKLSPQFIRAHTKETKYVTVRVTARKGE